MSFNQLPDELVQMTAKQLNLVDIVTMMQTQKRIKNILIRYKLNRPVANQIKVDFKNISSSMGLAVEYTSIIWMKRKVLNIKILPDDGDAIYTTINKFRSIHSLYLVHSNNIMKLNEELLRILSKVDTQISVLVLKDVNIDLSADKFVQLCKCYSKISLHGIVGTNNNIFCDDVFIRIIPHVKVSINFVQIENLDFSNRLLEAMMVSTNDVVAQFSGGRTSFTINKIRECIEAICSQNREFSLNFGILDRREMADYRNWCEEVEQLPESPYVIECLNWMGYTKYIARKIEIGTPWPSVAEFTFEEDLD